MMLFCCIIAGQPGPFSLCPHGRCTAVLCIPLHGKRERVKVTDTFRHTKKPYFAWDQGAHYPGGGHHVKPTNFLGQSTGHMCNTILQCGSRIRKAPEQGTCQGTQDIQKWLSINDQIYGGLPQHTALVFTVSNNPFQILLWPSISLDSYIGWEKSPLTYLKNIGRNDMLDFTGEPMHICIFPLLLLFRTAPSFSCCTHVQGTCTRPIYTSPL